MHYLKRIVAPFFNDVLAGILASVVFAALTDTSTLFVLGSATVLLIVAVVAAAMRIARLHRRQRVGGIENATGHIEPDSRGAITVSVRSARSLELDLPDDTPAEVTARHRDGRHEVRIRVQDRDL